MHAQDTITIVVGCPSEKVWLFTSQTGKGYCFPQHPGKNVSWSTSATYAYRSCTGLDVMNPSLWKIGRIWQPEPLNPSINAVFRIIIGSDIKKKIILTNSKEKCAWLTQEEINSLINQKELSPEVNCYVPVGAKETEPSSNILSTDVVSNYGILIETCKTHVITSAQYLQQASDMLLVGCKLTEKDQILLYKEYVSVTFPYVLMDLNSFKKICPKIGIPVKSAVPYFRAADAGQRGCISFKELIQLIAAIEPRALHTGTGLEQRIKLIFRYYDRNSDGRIEPHELKEIINIMQSNKSDANVSPKQIKYFKLNYDINLTFYRDFNVKDVDSMNLTAFTSFLSDYKLKGISNVFINNVSIFESIERLNKMVSPQSSIGTSPECPSHVKRIVKTMHTDSTKDQDYLLGSHCVRVGKLGVFALDQLQNVSNAFYKSTEASDLATSQPSLQLFDRFQSSSVVLTTLRDFANEDLNLGKASYSWEPEKFKNFATSLKDVCISLVDIFKKEPRLAVIKSPVYILGDIHGNFHDICTFEQHFWSMGIHLTPVSVLFLGDYVDRGEFGVEVIAYLFAQKFRNPHRVFLLRGNHEIRDVQKNFTFHIECMRKFGSTGQEMFEHINNVFDCLPLAAVIDDKIFCCHGGIPPPWLCPSINVINKIPCPLVKMSEESLLAWELVWNDPLKEGENVDMDSLKLQLSLNEGFANNKRRGTGHAFSYEALLHFLKINNLSYVVRAHESQFTGFQLQFKNKLLTVFSSSRYFKNNDAACILAQDRKLRIFRIDSESVYTY